jgi:hypothetical protein
MKFRAKLKVSCVISDAQINPKSAANIAWIACSFAQN